ncbi:hypothetical protein Bca52824_023191 [Brassica carinata]|uniref:Uncharacterized protein n=1 Tax=Brassica carinata TaxID=52824 RepID=A0A8X8ASA8_BRACI|nr:hypothetical protein Bca52824_023191 [Brassica carinata]
MANSKVFFRFEIWEVSVVEARLLRFWEARNFKRGGELMWADLLMIDVNVSVFFPFFPDICFKKFVDVVGEILGVKSTVTVPP